MGKQRSVLRRKKKDLPNVPYLSYAVVKRSREAVGDAPWLPCSEHPSQWDHQNYQYRPHGPSPLTQLCREFEQARDDGEACIFSQHDVANMISYLAALFGTK